MGFGRGRVACPVCRRPVDWNANEFRPFCSERCRLIDLGHWVDETYRVPGEPAGADDGSSTQRVPDDDDFDA
jgi:hypothetical protein